MRLRLAALAFAVALCVTTACSGGSGKSDKASATSTVAPGTSTTVKGKPEVTLPPNIPRSEQFCAFPVALANKLKGAKRPNGPEEVKPYIHDLATLFQQAAPAAPPQLAADVQKLNQFYTSLAQRLDSGTNGPSLPSGLADLTASSTRLRQYFKTVCGVDDSVFNFFS